MMYFGRGALPALNRDETSLGELACRIYDAKVANIVNGGRDCSLAELTRGMTLRLTLLALRKVEIVDREHIRVGKMHVFQKEHGHHPAPGRCFYLAAARAGCRVVLIECSGRMFVSKSPLAGGMFHPPTITQHVRIARPKTSGGDVVAVATLPEPVDGWTLLNWPNSNEPEEVAGPESPE